MFVYIHISWKFQVIPQHTCRLKVEESFFFIDYSNKCNWAWMRISQKNPNNIYVIVGTLIASAILCRFLDNLYIFPNIHNFIILKACRPSENHPWTIINNYIFRVQWGMIWENLQDDRYVPAIRVLTYHNAF